MCCLAGRNDVLNVDGNRKYWYCNVRRLYGSCGIVYKLANTKNIFGYAPSLSTKKHQQHASILHNNIMTMYSINGGGADTEGKKPNGTNQRKKASNTIMAVSMKSNGENVAARRNVAIVFSLCI
jgi:hypothetical protein